MPDNNESVFIPNSDQNTLAFAKNIARVYGEMGLLDPDQVQRAENASDIEIVDGLISLVGQLTEDKQLEFCERFISGDNENFNGATPVILAGAYRSLGAKVKNGDSDARTTFDALGARIDDMSNDFAESGGMIVDNGVSFPVVNLGNVADVYAGMIDMLNAHKADLNADTDADKIAQIDKNLEQLNKSIEDYDRVWGLTNLTEKQAGQLEMRWNEVTDMANRAKLTRLDDTSKFKFKDSNGTIIPQYVDKDGNEYEDWQEGRDIKKGGRLDSFVEFARHDAVKKVAADFQEPVNDDLMEQYVNEELMFKLYETSMADTVANTAMQDPSVFLDFGKRQDMLRKISNTGGEISDTAYNAAVGQHTNATAGWAARVKTKLGRGVKKVGHFFDRVFSPIKRVDNMKNVRMTNVDANEKRKNLFLRILKGFGTAFIASALITTIATAAATVAGVSLAVSMATIGIVAAIAVAALQISKWRKAQQARGEPTDIKAFLRDGQLVKSLGVSAIAAIAMCFGAAGAAQAAMALGYGALAFGGYNNAAAAYKAARASNISKAESIAWAIANAGAVIAGGFAGRAAANAAIDAYNANNPENEVFQHKTTRQESVETTRQETRMEYSQDALDNAERIAKMWYQDNPDLLQQRVDAINAYNMEHGTNIDPYRAIMIHGDVGGQTYDNMQLHVNNSHLDPDIQDVYSHGNHRVMTDNWGKQYGYSHDDLVLARHLFNADGTINQSGMDVVARLDNNVSATNTIGYVDGRPVHTDNYFKPNDPEGWTTYTDGKSAFVENTYEVPDVTTRTVTDFSRATGDAMATYGNYNQDKTTPRYRVGTFPRMPEPVPQPKPEPTPQPEPVPQPEPEPTPQPEPEPTIIDKPEPYQLPPAPGVRGYLPEGKHHKELPEGKDVRGYLPLGHPELPPLEDLLPKKQEWSELPTHEIRALPMGQELEFAITRSQAKAWIDLHNQLKSVQDKRRKNPQGTEAKKLQTMESHLQYEIARLRNKLGGASDEQIFAACPEALRRGDLLAALAELAKHEAIKPKGAYAGARMPAWERRREELLALIDELGGPDSLDETNRYQPVPIKGVQAQKKALRNQHNDQQIIIDEPVEGDIEDVDYEELETTIDEPSDVIVTPPPAPVQEQKDTSRDKYQTFKQGISNLSKKAFKRLTGKLDSRGRYKK